MGRLIPNTRANAASAPHGAGDRAEGSAHHVDPQIEDSARQSPVADVELYERPSTPRISPANIGLSIGVLLVALILGLVVLMMAI